MNITSAINRNIYHIKQNLLHKINPKKCNYVLLDKHAKEDIKILKMLKCEIPEQADTFSIVKIGKKDDKSYEKNITTFYSDGKIIHRTIEDSDGNKLIREYKYTGYDIKGSNSRGRNVTQKALNKITGDFETNLIEKFTTYKFEKDGKIKLQISKNEINDNIINATVTEYPLTGYKQRFKCLKKVLGLKLEMINEFPHIRETFETPNVKFSTNDKYLPFRFILNPETKLKALTKLFIKEKDLDKLKIKVEISEDIEENTGGYFSDYEGKIAYNKFCFSPAVKLASHEVEHAYQYRQIGRLGKGRNQYSKDSRNLYGRIENFEDSMEAHKYAVASENYPEIKKGEDLSKNPDYMNNYLEVKAREAEKKAVDEYYKMGESINKQFFFGIE